MSQSIVDVAKQRYTAKAYDSNRKIDPKLLLQAKALLRYCPSSVNSQPWYFVWLSSDAIKQKVTAVNGGVYVYNNPSILASSHTVIFCRRSSLDASYLEQLLAQEEMDGRFEANPAMKSKTQLVRQTFIDLHREKHQDLEQWMEKQLYINLGQFLLGVAALGIDATAMEGIDTQAVDDVLNLTEQGYTSILAVTLGYHHSENDINARLPKSRLPESAIMTEL